MGKKFWRYAFEEVVITIIRTIVESLVKFEMDSIIKEIQTKSKNKMGF